MNSGFMIAGTEFHSGLLHPKSFPKDMMANKIKRENTIKDNYKIGQ